jgi:hypothetical protein
VAVAQSVYLACVLKVTAFGCLVFLMDCKLRINYKFITRRLGRNSQLSFHNKLVLYKQIIRPVWSCGIQLWGCASGSNIRVIQRYQNKVLMYIVNAPWYFRNSDLHRDLGIETVTDIIAKFTKSHENRLHYHINIEASRLVNVNNITRRLKRKKPFELVIRRTLSGSMDVS